MTEPMELWNKVCNSRPEALKKVNQRGGFTAIDAQSQIKDATMQWGPYGGAWGVKNQRRECVKTPDGAVIEVCLHAVFFYPDGEFELGTDMAYKVGNDTSKKLLTDLTTKALSKLGFNSDVFEGKWDGCKYDVSGKPVTAPPVTPPVTPPADEQKRKAGRPKGAKNKDKAAEGPSGAVQATQEPEKGKTAPEPFEEPVGADTDHGQDAGSDMVDLSHITEFRGEKIEEGILRAIKGAFAGHGITLKHLEGVVKAPWSMWTEEVREALAEQYDLLDNHKLKAAQFMVNWDGESSGE